MYCASTRDNGHTASWALNYYWGTELYPKYETIYPKVPLPHTGHTHKIQSIGRSLAGHLVLLPLRECDLERSAKFQNVEMSRVCPVGQRAIAL